MIEERKAIVMRKASAPNGIYPFKSSVVELPARLAKLMHIENRLFTRQADELLQTGKVVIVTTREQYTFTTAGEANLEKERV